jgi:hypothetical protein
VRQGRLRGWGSLGYSPEVAKGLKEFSQPIDERWARRLHAAPAGSVGPSMRLDFGQPAPTECVDFALQVKGKPIAYIVLERHFEEQPWLPSAFAILGTVSRLRLDLDLALRRQQPTGAMAAPEPQDAQHEAAPTPVHAAPAPGRVPQPATPPPAAAAPSEIVEVAPVAEPARGDSPQIEAARRYARLVATDIRLYNEEAVLLGRRSGDLAERLGEQLGRGKEAFLRRHPDLGSVGERILLDAYVTVIAGGDAKLLGAAATE